MSDEPRRKLIEVALPLEAINRACAREKSIRQGHPSSMHLWWARRPLAACRAVLFASLIDDPSSLPDQFPSEDEQDVERERLFRLIERLVTWEATTDEQTLDEARAEVLRSTGGKPPPVLDPFCGGGSIPLEAQRLGLQAHGSDLNPVAVVITKSLIEIPPRFASNAPVNPAARESLDTRDWGHAQGLADDVRYYGAWMRGEAMNRIGHLYPMARVPDGSDAPVIAWLWTRTVKCSNPACGKQTPLLTSFLLASKKGKERYLHPQIEGDSIRFDIGDKPADVGDPKAGYKRGTSGIFECAFCGTVTERDYVAQQGSAGTLGIAPTAVVVKGHRSRVYLPAGAAAIDFAALPKPDTSDLEVPLAANPRDVWCRNFGLTTVDSLFTPRQLVGLTTFTDLVKEAREKVAHDAAANAGSKTADGQEGEGGDADAYADAVALYLALAVSRMTDYSSSLCTWASNPQMEIVRGTFARQALPMTWDFAEANIFGPSTGSFDILLEAVAKALERVPAMGEGECRQLDVTSAVSELTNPLVATDPPYYDNIAYADLSDFFYVWLRRSLKNLYPDLFSTLLTPKSPELVAAPHRFDGDRPSAQAHFERGLRAAFDQIHRAHAAEYPMTLFYAFKQAEADKEGLASTGWETMLEGLLGSGFMVTGTWPMRTERGGRSVAIGTAALASSVVLVCRPRPESAALATRKEFTAALRAELPAALRNLQQGAIAPVDLAQASIGPGMAVYSGYSKVVEADGEPMTVRTALALINEALDELLADQEADFDADTRWCVAWFEQHGMSAGPFGTAETLSRAKNTSIRGLVEAGVLSSAAGEVRLLGRDELAGDWDPSQDQRLTVWEVAQHLIRLLDVGGERAAADLLRRIGGLAEPAHELAYRLFQICDREGWAQEALGYNRLASAWLEITGLAAAEPSAPETEQESLI